MFYLTGATIHTVAGLWMNVSPRKNIPQQKSSSSNGTAAALQQSTLVTAAPEPELVGAAAFTDGSSSSSSSDNGDVAAAAAVPPAKCPFSGALGLLSSNGAADADANTGAASPAL